MILKKKKILGVGQETSLRKKRSIVCFSLGSSLGRAKLPEMDILSLLTWEALGFCPSAFVKWSFFSEGGIGMGQT